MTTTNKKKTVLLGWEFGANLGHITVMEKYASAFSKNGWDCVFALRDTSQAQTILGHSGFKWLQAPITVTGLGGLDSMINYADVLLHHGYASADSLLGLTRAWLTLCELVKPDLLLADSSPTMALVSRITQIPLCHIGNGFSVPPAVSPWPIFPGREKKAQSEPDRLIQIEQLILRHLNSVLQQFKQPALNQLADLYRQQQAFIYGLKALDHYDRADNLVTYVLPEAAQLAKAPVHWPITLGPADKGPAPKKVFVYLRTEFPGTLATLTALSALGTQVIAFIPDLSELQVKQLQSDTLLVSKQMVDVDAVLVDCDLVVCHGGGLSESALRAGIALYLLPTFSEQRGRAQRVEQLGCGLWSPVSATTVHKTPLKRLLQEPQFRTNAKKFSEKFQTDDIDQLQLEQAVLRICELCHVG
jgi:UDP:flavonoid glycosyltransferase YjiC (YdhE family)